ncbi:MAG: tetratricopeptide repeat protein [Oscillatoria sp. SIO1A7]|nr:tetratricopeptide repeat protein [Oscillatoria sp. SIO1A7]
MSKSTSEIAFKFRYLIDGEPRGFLAQSAIANEREISLGKERLTYNNIAKTKIHKQRLMLGISPAACLSEPLSYRLVNRSIFLEIYNAKARDVGEFIARISSRQKIAAKRERLIESGLGHFFHAVTCPECGAHIDISELENHRYIYCRFCDTIFQEKQPAITKGSYYRICDECQHFDRVKSYTEFYIGGLSWKRRHLCENCAHTVFWKTFLLNLPFILSVPPAIWIKLKSLRGRDPYLQQLARANALSKQRKYRQAAEIYRKLHDQYPEHPGLLMDEGLSHLLENDGAAASECFRRSLSSCSNYAPVLQLLDRLQLAIPKNRRSRRSYLI